MKLVMLNYAAIKELGLRPDATAYKIATGEGIHIINMPKGTIFEVIQEDSSHYRLDPVNPEYSVVTRQIESGISSWIDKKFTRPVGVVFEKASK